jgi:hypothetical protein
VLAVRHPGPYHDYVSEPFEIGTDGHKQTIRLQAAFGTLSVQSSPSGAEVWIGGKKVGTTPYTDPKYPSGTVELKVIMGFYQSARKTVTVQDEQPTDVQLELAENFGTLTVQSTPAGAEIFFGKKSTGERTPHTFGQLVPGVYAVGLKQHGYIEKFDKLDLKVGEKRTHAVTLSQALGLLVVTAEDLQGRPCQGEVQVDGEKVGTAPMKVKAQVGRREVRVACGSDWVLKQVDVPHNDSVRQVFKMVEAKARVARMLAEKRREAAATRAKWAGIFANYPEPYKTYNFSISALYLRPGYHRISMTFDDNRRVAWNEWPFSALTELGGHWWWGRFGFGIHGPLMVSIWGNAESMQRTKLTKLSQVSFNTEADEETTFVFNPKIALRYQLLVSYERLTLDARYTTFVTLDEIGFGLRKLDKNEDSTKWHERILALHIVDLGITYQPQEKLVLSPSGRFILGESYGRVQEETDNDTDDIATISHEFADFAAGGYVEIPVMVADWNHPTIGTASIVTKGWYFQGPIFGGKSSLSDYRDFGGRVYFEMSFF